MASCGEGEGTGGQEHIKLTGTVTVFLFCFAQWGAKESVGSGVRLSFDFSVCHLLAVYPWANNPASPTQLPHGENRDMHISVGGQLQGSGKKITQRAKYSSFPSGEHSSCLIKST